MAHNWLAPLIARKADGKVELIRNGIHAAWVTDPATVAKFEDGHQYAARLDDDNPAMTIFEPYNFMRHGASFTLEATDEALTTLYNFFGGDDGT